MEECEDSDIAHAQPETATAITATTDAENYAINGGTRVVVVDKETNTDAASSRGGRQSRGRHGGVVPVHETHAQNGGNAAAVRNSAIRRSQTFSPSGKVMPQIHKVRAAIEVFLSSVLKFCVFPIELNLFPIKLNLFPIKLYLFPIELYFLSVVVVPRSGMFHAGERGFLCVAMRCTFCNNFDAILSC